MKEKILLRAILILGVVALIIAAGLNFSFDMTEDLNDYYVLASLSTILSFELYRKQKLRKSFYETEEYKDIYDSAVKQGIANSDVDKYLLVPYYSDLNLFNLNRLVGILSIFMLAYFNGFIALYFVSFSVVVNLYMIKSLYNTRMK